MEASQTKAALLGRLAGGILCVWFGVFAVACNDAERDDSGAIIEGGEVGAGALRVGDCFNDGELASSDEVVEVSEVPGVPCNEPHDNEVYHLIELPSGDFPGDSRLEGLADEVCLSPFEAFVGLDYASSRFDYGWFIPTSGSWSAGDREIACFLYDFEFQKLTGSMRNSRE